MYLYISVQETQKSFDNISFEGSKLKKANNSNVNEHTIQRNDSITSDSSSILLLSIAFPFIVISLVLVIIVFRVVRVRVTPQNQSNFSNRRVFQVTSQYDVHTYCEIDGRNTRGTDFSIPIELRNYESINQSHDAAKYTELPAKNSRSAEILLG